ncbi:MAG TPA: 1,4-alpha-glucan branching protein GlgB [Ktedonobacterales bacterium]
MADQRVASVAEVHDPLDPGAIAAIASGRHGAPFDVLGPRVMALDGRSVWIIRAFLPGAERVWVVTTDNRADSGANAPGSMEMRLLHSAGLYSLVMPGETAPHYQLRVRWQSGLEDTLNDPYAFGPQITEYDLYLIGEGNHLHLYDVLGAHPNLIDSVQGVRFAVWAPNARRVSVVGDFNSWNETRHPMRLRSGGVWELFLPGVTRGTHYKYSILSWNSEHRGLKADPVAFFAERRPGTASKVWDISGYEWHDAEWMRNVSRGNGLDQSMAVYELHLGSWRPDPGFDNWNVTYRQLAPQLATYVADMGYTHVELMPIAEHPFDGSWGYQVTGYFAPTSRYGTPDDFMYFVDYLHQRGIGVIVDWVPAHFPKDDHGLAYFDGSHLYEHADPRQGEHPDWGTLVFNFSRNEVRNFLIANALFWMDKYHVDGLRVDAVASMLYLDYSRKEGEWLPNQYGGRENLAAIEFLKRCNATVADHFPHHLMIAEESTAWPGVTSPTSEGGLGFSLKWNMGWMHDILDYFQHDPIHRQYHQNELTFSFVYAFSERFMLPFSHDEVVHLKGSMLTKMPGDNWQKFANLRALYTFMYGHPGKKLLFMGAELGQWTEWSEARFLDWGLLDEQNPDVDQHRGLHALMRDLNGALRECPALYERDFSPSGFEWIDGSDAEQSVVAFARWGADGRDMVVVAGNFTPIPREEYRIGVSRAGKYEIIVNSDEKRYGGAGYVPRGVLETQDVGAHGKTHSLVTTLPPLATVFLRYLGAD